MTYRQVNQAVMPKGVEHSKLLERISVLSVVNQAVMPKGVEHILLREYRTIDADM